MICKKVAFYFYGKNGGMPFVDWLKATLHIANALVERLDKNITINRQKT